MDKRTNTSKNITSLVNLYLSVLSMLVYWNVFCCWCLNSAKHIAVSAKLKSTCRLLASLHASFLSVVKFWTCNFNDLELGLFKIIQGASWCKSEAQLWFPIRTSLCLTLVFNIFDVKVLWPRSRTCWLKCLQWSRCPNQLSWPIQWPQWPMCCGHRTGQLCSVELGQVPFRLGHVLDMRKIANWEHR